ncbi:unnamed protein product [Didymodactylos carnosus]|uniref:Uncharacterized protein n=1 Tax=Didymodactylos carnosus TaxID=1234261 RepID=A0A815EZS5_9BILA|nr:unnamed protein product [Didymodactylos carnosus]CAF1534150.1 unnamed protein product [Didymodactylos carnosus]CAF4161954.1 unnamed protein product [Didymodactylos carnosus]CAF4321498.1 unnamed protein product [Didymodactylos carnosus]
MDNVLVQTVPTGEILPTANLTWNKYGTSFVAPNSSVILHMISNANGGDGNDFVVDDITVAPCLTPVCGGYVLNWGQQAD